MNRIIKRLLYKQGILITHRQEQICSWWQLSRIGIKGLEHSKGIPRMITLEWCLVLVAFTKAPVEPIVTCSLKHLTWKACMESRLLALRSLHLHTELQDSCCQFRCWVWQKSSKTSWLLYSGPTPLGQVLYTPEVPLPSVGLSWTLIKKLPH